MPLPQREVQRLSYPKIQGRDNVRKYMVENKEFTAEIDRQVRELLKNNSGYLPSEADDSDNTDGEQPTETETTETTEE